MFLPLFDRNYFTENELSLLDQNFRVMNFYLRSNPEYVEGADPNAPEVFDPNQPEEEEDEQVQPDNPENGAVEEDEDNMLINQII
jgi:hypothetical protein